MNLILSSGLVGVASAFAVVLLLEFWEGRKPFYSDSDSGQKKLLDRYDKRVFGCVFLVAALLYFLTGRF